MKKKSVFWHCSAVFLGLVLSCKDSNPVSHTSEVPTQLEGTWSGVNRNGIDQMVWTYIMKNDSITIKADSLMRYRGTFCVDTAASPATIDIAITQSSITAYAGKKILGLYVLAGKVLNITANDPGTARPDSLGAAPVLGLFLNQ